VGVNTFVDAKTLKADYIPPKIEMARASYEEKQAQLDHLHEYQEAHKTDSAREIANLKRAALAGENVFAALMSAARVCSLYQMTQALYEAGGQYRRNL
jgi:isobutyryl-CoA mutase